MAEFPVQEYDQHLVESVLDWSYMKQVHFRSGADQHEYRVGPLARINACGSYGTEWADREYASFREQFGAPCHSTVMQSYAKLIELVWAVENAASILDNPLVHGETRVPVKFAGGRGVGHSEAPRGTLIHDYEIDENGIVRAANLIVATQQNYTLINKTVMQAAESHVVGRTDDAALLNAIEFGIRCYDPCLSCATHALGPLPLEVAFTRGGAAVRTIRRGC
jgi:F420-non-reducing hydrogenase large subunit